MPDDIYGDLQDLILHVDNTLACNRYEIEVKQEKITELYKEIAALEKLAAGLKLLK